MANPMNMKEAMARVKKQMQQAKTQEDPLMDLNGTKGSESWNKKQQ